MTICISHTTAFLGVVLLTGMVIWMFHLAHMADKYKTQATELDE